MSDQQVTTESTEVKTLEGTPAITSEVKTAEGSSQVTSTDLSTLLSGLPEELRSDPSLSNVKDSATLVKNYINAQKMIGNSIRIPRQDDPQEMKDSFFNKLKDIPGIVKLPTPGNKAEQDALFAAMGRPMTADGYKIEAPEGQQVSDDVANAFKGLAHNIGLSQNQVKAISDFQFKLEAQARLQNAEEVKATTETLKAEWGKDFDNRISAVKELISTYGAKYPDQAAALADSRIINNPVVLMAFADLAKTYKERGMLAGNSQVKFGLTPDEAREKILEVRGNPELYKAYTDDRHPNHKAIVDKMQQYYNAASS